MNDNKRKLYDALSKDYDMGTYEQFSQDVQDENKRKKLYDAIKGEYDLPDFDGFTRQLGVVSPQQKSTSAAAPPPTQTKQPKQQKKWTQSPADIARSKQFVAGINQHVKQGQERMQNMHKYTQQRMKNPLGITTPAFQIGVDKKNKPTMFDSNNVVDGGIEYNPQTRKMEKTYLTQAGNKYTSKFAANMEQRHIDDALERELHPVETKLRDAYAERDRLNKLASQRVEELENAHDKLPWYLQLGEYTNSDKMPDAGSPVQRWDKDMQYKQYMAALRKNKELITTLEDARDKKTNSFWHSLGTEIANGYTFSFGGKARMDDAVSLVFAQHHIDTINKKRQNGEKLTKEEEAAEAVLKNAEWDNRIQGQYGDQYGAWARAGKMGAVSADLMLDFLMMGGQPAGLAKNVLKGGTRLLGNAATKGFGKYMLKATGATVGSMVAGAEIANTVQLGRTMADAAGRYQGDVMLNENGDYVFGHFEDDGNGGQKFVEGGDSILGAVLGAERSAITENASEIVGAFLPGSKVFLKGMEKIGLSKIANGLTALSGKQWYRTYSKALETIGFHGVPGEAMEEYGGIAYDAMLGGDDWKSLGDKRTHVDIWLGCATMGALLNAPRVIGTGTQMAQYYRYKHNTDKADRLAGLSLTDELWKPLREQIDNATNGQITDVVMGVLSDNSLNDEQKKSVLKYVQNLQKMRGYSLGRIATEDRTDDAEPQTQDEVDEQNAGQNFTLGYNASDDVDMQDINNRVEMLGEEITNMFGEDILHELEAQPIETLRSIRKFVGYSDQQKQTAVDYVNSKYAYDGMIQRVRDDIDSEIDQSDAMVDSRVNKEDGMIHQASMKEKDESGNDKQVYIVSGHVLMLPDGTMVDTENSDSDIIVRDVQTGKLQFMSSKDLLYVGEAMDAEQVKEEAREAIRQQKSQEAANRIEGILAFTPGETYQLTDENGEQHSYTILDDGGDANGTHVTVAIDGNQQQPLILPKEQLQGMADAQNRSRVSFNQQQVDDEILPTEQEESNITEAPVGVSDVESNISDSTEDDAMPMIEVDGKMKVDWSKATPARAHAYLFNERGLSRENANVFVENNRKAAASELEKLRKKQRKMVTDLDEFEEKTAEWQDKMDELQRQHDYWQAIKDEQNKIIQAEAEERAKRNAEAHDAAVVEEQQRQAEELAKREEQTERGAYAVHPAIRDKWEAASKIDGVEDEITLANGERVKGHYVLVESGAATPSHNPNAEFTRNDGFPVDENGNTVNDRDYERDKEAQAITRQTGSSYDSRAIQNIPVVSNDGIVLSGNGRTMAGELAARDNTDGAYIEHLRKYPQQFGFTAEQVQGMQHPRVLFVPDEAMPYTTETFAKFNAQDMKSQSRTEQSVKLGKTVDDATFNRVIRSINGFDTIGDFYNDTAASTEAIAELRNAGVINSMQYAEMFDGEKVSGTGRQMLENMLIGKAFESNPDAIRQLSEYPAMRQSVISALAEISNNVGLGEEYSIESELAEAINLAYQARKNGYKAGEQVSNYARQLNLFPFDMGETVADYTNATVLMLADVLNDNRVSMFKKTLAIYNHAAAESAAGQIDIFSGGVKTKDEIIKDVLNTLNYGTQLEQQAALAAAVERRKTEATEQSAGSESVQQDGIDGESRTRRSEEGRHTDAQHGISGTDLVGKEFTLSEQTADNGEHFFQDRNGNIDLVDMPQEVFEAIDYPKAPLRLTPSMISHMIGQHGKETGAKDVDKAIEFILDVMSHFDHVRLGRGGALIFSVENDRAKTGKRAISILLSSKTGDFYGIVSSGYEGVERLKKRHQLWAGSAIITPATDSATEPVTTLDAQQGGGQIGRASGQSDTSSAGKGSENSATEQEKTEKVAENQTPNAVQAALATAEQETNTEPTEAQKEAGNYKKGHVKIDGYDVTIENPKGSVRRGTDASGKQWEQEMQNTYGYIRGTEGVDGDHIDVFFSEDPSQGDVFVVDQVNKDGSFDEHKVMYGFPDIESARKAYLSNYEDGWQGLGAITPVSKEEFKKWIDSSHRKTKPFAEYSSVKPLGDTQLGEQPNKPTVKAGEDYVSAAERIAKEHEVKRTAAHFAEETQEEATDFDKRVPEMDDAELLAYMQEDGNGDVNKSHHPSVYDEYDYRHGDEQLQSYDDTLVRLNERGTTLEQAEEMLANIQKDLSRLATEDRAMLLGQEEALQEYIAGLEKEGERDVAIPSQQTEQNERDTTSSTIKENGRLSELRTKYPGRVFGEQHEDGSVTFHDEDALLVSELLGREFDGEDLTLPKKEADKALQKLLANGHKVGFYGDEYKPKYDEHGNRIEQKKNSALDNTTDTGKTSERGKRNDTATPQSTVSIGKGTDLLEDEQGSGKKSSSDGKIDDVGEVLAGARKDMRKEIAKSLANVTEAALVEKPFGKVYKKPDLKKAVESGALREKDAIFYEALFSMVNQQKPKVTQSEMRSKRYIPDFKTRPERWAADTFKQMEVLRHFMELDEVGRDAMMEQMLADRYPTREQELAEIEKRKGWNPDYEGHKYEWGEMTTPNPLWVTHEVMNRLGYSVGDKLDVPYGVVKANTSGTGYSIENLKGERSSLFGSGMTLDEAIDRIVYLAKLKRGDADVSHPTQLFAFPATKSESGESGRYRVMWGRDYKTREFDSKDEADAFAQTKNGAYVSPIMETKRKFGYKVRFTHPLTGEKMFVDDTEFDTKEEAHAYFDGNFEKLNEATNAKLQEEREKKGEKKTLTADDVVHVTMVHSGKGGWAHTVVIDKKYANNDGQVRIIKEGFASRNDAKTFADHVKEDVLKTVLKHKEEAKKIVYFDTGENSRIGEDYRNGKDVDAEDFMNTFGFRGVQFGNWTNQTDRQMAVNQAYDAFMDMARLIGVSPKAMSLNGELGIAFGARGVGGFAAHYEPGEVVINLTKTQGAGSLAHEWWHALDNYFARRAGSAGDMVTDNRRIEMRDALRKAFNDMLDLVNGSDYAQRSAAKGEYWGRTREITARLLAEWVDKELQKRGELNTFLSRGAVVERGQQANYATYSALEVLAGREPMSFDDYKETPESLKGIPYPSAKEVEQFGGSLRHIFDTLEEKVDEETGNVMLYEPTATYETRDGGKVVCRSLFDEMGMRSSDEVAMVSQHIQQGQGQNQVIAPSEIRLRKLKKGETCHVERVYEETKQFDFTGKEKVESAEDVAYIFRQLENAAVENSFLVLVKDGHPTVIHLGVGNYVSVMAPYEQAFVAYRKLKPEQVYFVHNHPSGTLKASRQDQDLLNRIKRAFGEDVVQQGIIIDTTSGNYGEFESIETAFETYSVEEEMPQSQGGEVPVKVYQFSRQVFDSDWNPESAFKIVSSQSVAEFVSSHRLGEHKKMSFLVVNNNGNVVANVFLPWTKLSDIKRKKDAGDLLAGYVHQCGGVRGVLYGNYDYESDDRAVLASVGFRMRQLNAPLMDALHVGHSAYENGWAGVGEPKDGYGVEATPFHNIIDEMFDNEDFDKSAHARERYDLGVTPDWMKSVGITGDRFSLSFKNIKTHQGKDADHNLTRDEWHQLPEAIKMPFLVTKRKETSDKFRLYVNILHNGHYVAVGVDVKRVNQGKYKPMLEVNSIKTVFGHKEKLSANEVVLTYDKNITPEQEALLRGLDYREYPTIQELSAAKVGNNSDIAKESGENVIKTEAFKGWFGDWENAPDDASKMVDEAGKPKVFYHNTPNEFTVFDASRNGTHNDAGWLGDGFYFYGVEYEGGGYGSNKLAVYLNIRNPYYATSEDVERLSEANSREESIAFRERLEEEGYDGVYYNGDLREEAVAFYSNQIKSATDNVGTYDSNNDDVRYRIRDYEPANVRRMMQEDRDMMRSAVQQMGEEEKPQTDTRHYSSKEQYDREAFAERQWRRAHNVAKEWIEKLNIAGNTEVYDSIDEVPDNESFSDLKRRSKGWYSPKTDRIVIVLGNHRSPNDVLQTILHEGVAHHGLRKMFGNHFDDFLDNVYNGADIRIKERIAAKQAVLMSKVKNSKRTAEEWRRLATEEYLAELAESTDFENAENRSWTQHWFNRIKSWFLDMLHNLGLKGFGGKAYGEIGDNELRYILWRSYKNLAEPGRYRNVFQVAEDVAMQNRLGVGNYAKSADLPTNEQGISAEDIFRDDEITAHVSGIRSRHGINGGSMMHLVFNQEDIDWMHGKINEEAIKSIQDAYNERGTTGLYLPYNDLVVVFTEKVADEQEAEETWWHEQTHGFWHHLSQEEREAYGSACLDYVKRNYPYEYVKIVKGYEESDWQNEACAYFIESTIRDYGTSAFLNAHFEGNEKIVTFANEFRNYIKNNGTGKEKRNQPQQGKGAGETSQSDNQRGWYDQSQRVSKEEVNRRSSGDDDATPRALARDTYERLVLKGTEQFAEAVQDSMRSLKNLYRAITQAEGTKGHIEDVSGFENAYLAENRMHSASQAQIDAWEHDFIHPLVKIVSKITGSNKKAYAELIDYMMAKHGLERNQVLAERDFNKYQQEYPQGTKTLDDFREKDYSGLTALTGEDDVMIAEGIAQQMVDDYEREHDLEITELWDRINAATKSSLEKTYMSGMMSRERYEQVRDMFEYYIPLQGFDSAVAEDVYAYVGSDGTRMYGTPIRTAKGRKSKADDPLATIQMNGEAAIRQGNRNVMKQRFLNFVQNHPSDLVSVSDVWLRYNDVTDEWEQYFDVDLKEDDTPDEVERKTRDFEERMKQLSMSDPDHYKRGGDLPGVPYRVLDRNNAKQHQVLVRRNGKSFVLTINGNPRAAQALNGLTNPDVFTEGFFGKAMNFGQFFNRQLSALYTTRNPEFVISNFIRDAIYSNCMTWVKESRNYALRFHKNFGKVNPAFMSKMFAEWESGELRKKVSMPSGSLGQMDYMRKRFYEFMMNGGETGWTNLRDIEKHKRDLEKSIKRENSTTRKAWKALGGMFDLTNRSVENCARFAAYLTSREMGRSLDRSIFDAKEISVNFNKKGASDKFLTAKGQTAMGKVGATIGGAGRGFYVFWNASLQGLNNIARTTGRHPFKAAGLVTSLFTLGSVIPILSALVGGDDDDDKDSYYNLPEYIRRSNICFRWSNDMPWVTIPLPIEFRAIYGLGELATGVISGKERYSDEEFAKQFTSQISQVLPLDFMEGGGGWHAFIPTLAKPFVEAYSNRGWTGLPIYRENKFKPYAPQWTRAYDSANQQLVTATRWLNEVTGGSDVTQGCIDWNPAKVEYMLKGYLGGVFTMYDRLEKSAETILGQRDFEWRNVPVASRVLKQGDERTAARKARNEYFNLLKEYDKTKTDLNELRKIAESDREDALSYAKRIDYLHNSRVYTHYLIMDSYKPLFDAYYKLEKDADDADKLQIQQEENTLRRELVDLIHAVDDGKDVDVDAHVINMMNDMLKSEREEVSKAANRAYKRHDKNGKIEQPNR